MLAKFQCFLTCLKCNLPVGMWCQAAFLNILQVQLSALAPLECWPQS